MSPLLTGYRFSFMPCRTPPPSRRCWRVAPARIVRNREGVSPLLQAVFGTNQPAVELLLAHQADPNPGRTQDGWNPLLSAAAMGYKPIAELLLKAGAEVDAKDKDGQTPLYAAVRHDQRGLAELLLANKANPNAKDNNGLTPLHFAANNGKQEMAELLLANKADPNDRDNQGRTPLDLAKTAAQERQPMPPGTYPSYPGQTMPPTPAQRSKFEAMASCCASTARWITCPGSTGSRPGAAPLGIPTPRFPKARMTGANLRYWSLLAVQYNLLAASPNEGGGAGYTASALFGDSRLPFPDLAHLHISRPAAGLKSWRDQVVDLRPVLESGDCARDVRLDWGDIVEVPEADHPLNERWGGFSAAELANFKKCLTRQVQIVVKDVATPTTLAPRMYNLEAGSMPMISPYTPFWLRPVLLESKLVLVSSDLSRVKVTRRDPVTGQQREWVVDCSEASPAPDLWLQDGDRIEVPEKTYGSAAQAEVPQPSVADGVPPITPLRPAVIDPATGLPARQAGMPQAGAAAAAFASRYGLGGRSAPSPRPSAEAASAEAAFAERYGLSEQPLTTGGVRYSPKPDDSELLNAGYHKDRSAKTRKAEFWEQRAASEAEWPRRQCRLDWHRHGRVWRRRHGHEFRQRRAVLPGRRHLGHAAAGRRAFFALRSCDGLDGQGGDCLGRVRRSGRR